MDIVSRIKRAVGTPGRYAWTWLRWFRARGPAPETSWPFHDLTVEEINSAPREKLNSFYTQIGTEPRQVVNDLRRRLSLEIAHHHQALPGVSGAVDNTALCRAYGAEGAMPISNKLVEAIGQAFASREISQAIYILNGCRQTMANPRPLQANATILLDYFAWGVDIDSSFLTLVERLSREFDDVPRPAFAARERAHLSTALGLVDLHRGNTDAAISRFRAATNQADAAWDTDMMIVSRYFTARACWKKARYREALPFVLSAIELQQRNSCPRRLAVIRLTHAWLLFQLGSIRKARQILNECDASLRESGDIITKGDILSFRGRLAKEKGDLRGAIKMFWRAIDEYGNCDPRHAHVARTYINLANVCHLRIRELRRKEHRLGDANRLWHEALRFLELAEDIYRNSIVPNTRGVGKAQLARALLHADAEHTDEATQAAAKAFLLGKDSSDFILMGRAKRIQWKTESDPQEAIEIGQQTINYAEKTDNVRLKARAYLYYGNSLLSCQVGGRAARLREAGEYANKAVECLKPDLLRQPYWRKALEGLRQLIASKTPSAFMI
jgi:tetratricopeptide (TPR) repeat protein